MLAIVIPYYKRDYLNDTLLSLQKQSCPDFTVYIGDDASPQDPRNILFRFSSSLNLNYCRFSQNLGSTSLVAHWERCIEMVKTEKWIMILGDDDYLGDDVVQSFYDSYRIFNNKANVVRFSSQLINENYEKISPVYSQPIWEKPTESFFRKFKNNNRSSLSEYIFEKKKYEKHRFRDFPLGWYSDDYAWLEFTENKPIFSMDATVFIRFSGLSISGKTDNLKPKATARLLFYKALISEKLTNFTLQQRLEILTFYEQLLRNGRLLNFSNIIILLYFHLKYLRSHSISKYSTHLAKSFLKK